MLKLHASLSQAGRGKEANSRLVQWLKENPTDVPLRMYLAEVYLADGQTRSAIEQYEIVLQQNPKYMPAMNNLATAYQQEKNPLALEYAEKAYKIAPDNPAIMTRWDGYWWNRTIPEEDSSVAKRRSHCA